MKRFFSLMGISLLYPLLAAGGQILPANSAGVTLGYWHTIVRDVDVTKKFWSMMGGTPLKIDGVEVIKMPGVLIFMTQGEPAGGNDGNKGTAIDHPGFTLRNGEELLNKLKAAGYKVEPIGNPIYGPESGYVTTPDGLRIEMQGLEASRAKRPALSFTGKNLDVPVATDHLHYFVPVSAASEAQAWYGKLFGANLLQEENRDRSLAGDLPGIRLRFAASRNATALLPTKGRAMDRIGFEVKNLEAFCKRLEASGVKLDQPYSKTRHKNYASAELTDPWGVSIELTEGLSRF
ncbi:MAG TPA: VOC family protein [Terriglobia bacterium]|nr:VOC family protein [Terriglobia bacterium]